MENNQYDMQYHYHLQGYIYNLLKESSRYGYIHEKEGYKFFCFSNIFPAYDLKKDDIRTLIISSPDNEFIRYLFEKFNKQPDTEVKVGSMKFRTCEIRKISPKIPANSKFTLITGTPIIVRIRKEEFVKYGVDLGKKYDYIYWRIEYPVKLFISHLQTNLLNKYREYNKNSNRIDKAVCEQDHEQEDRNSIRSEISELSLFQEFKFKKQVSSRILMKGQEHIVIGTLWEFSFEPNSNQELIQFGLDCGLGERNSLGFGFMNISNQ